MCAQGRPDEDEHSIRIHAGRYSDAYLQRVSWQLGYTTVVWRGRHVPEPTELDAQEAAVTGWRSSRWPRPSSATIGR
jgi:hypothetical protein